MRLYRRIQIGNELRYYSRPLEDGEPPLRAKRRCNLLSEYCFDDFPREDYKNRSWKKHRKTQYKPKEIEKPKKHSKFRGHINPERLSHSTRHTWCLVPYWDYGETWKWRKNTIYYYEGCSNKKYQYISYNGQFIDKKGKVMPEPPSGWQRS